MMRLIPQSQLERAAPFIRAAAHPVRLRILDFLQNGPAAVGDIVKATGCAQATTSQHLAVMRREGILATRRAGRRVLYRVDRREILGLLECIQRHCRRVRR